MTDSNTVKLWEEKENIQLYEARIQSATKYLNSLIKQQEIMETFYAKVFDDKWNLISEYNDTHNELGDDRRKLLLEDEKQWMKINNFKRHIEKLTQIVEIMKQGDYPDRYEIDVRYYYNKLEKFKQQ